MATNPSSNPLDALLGALGGPVTEVLDALLGAPKDLVLEGLLEAAREAWDGDLKQSELNERESEYLRGQVELIVNYLTATGVLEYSALVPDTEAMCELIADRILSR